MYASAWVSSEVIEMGAAAMESQLVIALVVLVAVAAHLALYRWVKFKIQEGVILQFLRDAGEDGAPGHRRGRSPGALKAVIG